MDKPFEACQNFNAGTLLSYTSWWPNAVPDQRNKFGIFLVYVSHAWEWLAN